MYCNTPDIAEGAYHTVLTHEMIAPAIDAGIEKWGYLSRERINGRNIAALVSIAWEARESQILGARFTAMLLCEDMVNLVANDRVVVVYSAVLTTPFCSLSD